MYLSVTNKETEIQAVTTIEQKSPHTSNNLNIKTKNYDIIKNGEAI
jgi:alpha-acetolactate decarboxylase